MRIAFLSGAYKNAGDFLIEKRSIDLLKFVHPGVEIFRCLRNKIVESIEVISQCDNIVFGGGPIYKQNLDGYLPLDTCINKMYKPIYILGGGWYGLGSGSRIINNYKFTDKTKAFLKKIVWGGVS